uniref:thymidine kinase n=1 Tax=viral metagenome TaxID=1070528 RepID=A0A6C0J3S5_9ZZZZ
MTHNGSLDIILGPMFSGKTTRIIELYEKYLSENKKPIAINFANDTRYHDKMLSTHDKRMIPCVQCMNLVDVLLTDDIQNSSIILINEGQFFNDLYDNVILLVEKYKKHVIIGGLDGDFKRVKFGQLCDLLPFCDTVIKLYASCNCGKPAIFSHRVTNEVTQVVIGSSNYIPLCRTCYLDINNLSTTICEGCDNYVLEHNSQPFIEDKQICNNCIDSNLNNKILYNCCNICDKYYHVADDTNDYHEHYDGDVCNLCLPEVINNNITTCIHNSSDNLFNLSGCSDSDSDNDNM